MHKILNTKYYQELANNRTDIEIWDVKFSEHGWSYFSIVAFNQGTAKIMAYVRVQGSQTQRRIYDENGDDLWIDLD